MSDYFVIDGRDGTPTIEKFNKKELERAIGEGFFGQNCVADIDAPEVICEFGDDAVTIIKGKLIRPRSKEAVTVWEVD